MTQAAQIIVGSNPVVARRLLPSPDTIRRRIRAGEDTLDIARDYQTREARIWNILVHSEVSQ